MKQASAMNKAQLQKNDKSLLSPNPNRAMQEMMDMINELRGLLDEETDALNSADSKTFMKLQDKKLEIARNYQSGISQILSRKEEIKTASEDLRRSLEQSREDFTQTVKLNLEALERMQKGTKRLGERIINVARDAAKKENQFVYGAHGHMQTASKASIGVNESA